MPEPLVLQRRATPIGIATELAGGFIGRASMKGDAHSIAIGKIYAASISVTVRLQNRMGLARDL
jgi:hypothetical protein